MRLPTPLPAFTLASTVITICCGPLSAHDMWIEPATFQPAPTEIVSVKLLVGQNILGDPLARDSGLIKQFVIADASGTRPVVGRDGNNPAGFTNVLKPGLAVIGYNSNPSSVEETAEKFNQYLKEEGLDNIAALRASRHETSNKVREQFSRCAKSLVLSGSPSNTQTDQLLGFPLELLAERNPYALRASEELPVRLMYQNRPLAGALVIAMNRLKPAEKISARTGADGRVRLKLKPNGGMWMIKAVHTIPAPAGSNADWSSYWASLTFEAPNKAAQVTEVRKPSMGSEKR